MKLSKKDVQAAYQIVKALHNLSPADNSTAAGSALSFALVANFAKVSRKRAHQLLDESFEMAGMVMVDPASASAVVSNMLAKVSKPTTKKRR